MRGARLANRLPTAEEYNYLREAVGWPSIPPEAAEKGLSKSLYSVCVTEKAETVGMGRVVGDGALYFYLQDVIVLPAKQRNGLGTMITRSLLRYIRTNAPPGAFIGLMAANGIDTFYKKFGFEPRPSGAPGMFMMIPEPVAPASDLATAPDSPATPAEAPPEAV